MSILNKTVGSLSRDNARLEQEKSFRTTTVYIMAISPDQTRARVKPIGGASTDDTIEARVILTPGMYCPINVSNYIGILHGDPKNPIGVQLLQKATPRPALKHGTSTGLFGQTGNSAKTPVTGQAVIQTDNIQQYINEQGYPSAQAIVIKPVKPIPPDLIGLNPIIPEAAGYYTDNFTSYISVAEDEVRIIGDFGNAILVNSQAGITMMGKINIGSNIQDVRIGGAWRFNPIMQYQIPSTAVSPIPTLIYDVPGQNLTQGIQPLINTINNS